MASLVLVWLKLLVAVVESLQPLVRIRLERQFVALLAVLQRFELGQESEQNLKPEGHLVQVFQRGQSSLG
jgi:hypothetical protein